MTIVPNCFINCEMLGQRCADFLLNLLNGESTEEKNKVLMHVIENMHIGVQVNQNLDSSGLISNPDSQSESFYLLYMLTSHVLQPLSYSSSKKELSTSSSSCISSSSSAPL